MSLSILMLFLNQNVSSTFSPCLGNFLSSFFSDYPTHIIHQQEELDIANLNDQTVLIRQRNTSTIIFEKGLEKWVNYLVVVNNKTELDSILEELSSNKQWNSKMKHLVIVTDDDIQEAKSMLQKMWSNDIYNSVLIFASQGYTWYPFKRSNQCGRKIVLKKFDICKKDFDPFRGKMPSKFEGCSLNVHWQRFPLMVSNPLNKKGPGAGVMIRLLNLISEMTNLKMDYQNNSDSRVFAEHVSTRTMPRLLKAVIDERIDVIANCYWPHVLEHIGIFIFARYRRV